jgi:zinc transporter
MVNAVSIDETYQEGEGRHNIQSPDSLDHLTMGTASTDFGSDKNGMVWGYGFSPGQPARPVDCESAERSLADQSPAASESFVWLHFSLANAAAERWLEHNLSLPEEFFASLHESVGSTKVEQAGDSLLAVIHDVLFDFTFSASDVSTVYLCVERRLLVSARPKPLRSIDRLRAAVKGGEVFRSTGELLAHLLRDQANVLVEIVRQATLRVDSIEDKLLSSRISISRGEFGVLRRCSGS